MEKKLEILCQTVGKLKEIKGRKKLQKMFHIAQCLGYPIDYDFNWGNYGAFSTELQHDLELLRNQGFIKENTKENGNFVEYDYYPMENCNAYIGKEIPELKELFFQLIHFLNEKETSLLELWSSIFYLLAQGDEGERLVTFLRHLKPQFDEETIKKALEDLNNLKENYLNR